MHFGDLLRKNVEMLRDERHHEIVYAEDLSCHNCKYPELDDKMSLEADFSCYVCTKSGDYVDDMMIDRFICNLYEISKDYAHVWKYQGKEKTLTKMAQYKNHG